MTLRSGKTSIIIPILIVVLVALVVFIDAKRRSAEKQLKELSVQMNQVQQGGDSQQNQEKAKGIVDQVRKLMDIPSDTEPTVATIVDVKKLQAQNPFYNKAQNGDYLIVTPSRAILFSATKNIILDVVPVQLEQAAAASSSAKSTAKAAAAMTSHAATSHAATSTAMMQTSSH